MREGIGETFTYNIIIIFIIIVIGLLAATISYYKAYKVNNRILDSIEKYEGYNEAAKTDIRNKLSTIGYTINNGADTCAAQRSGKPLVSASNGNSAQDTTYYYCVYYFEDDRGASEKKAKKTNQDGEPIYYNYSVVSYIYIDIPLLGNFKIPVYTKGERTYNFSDRSSATA